MTLDTCWNALTDYRYPAGLPGSESCFQVSSVAMWARRAAHVRGLPARLGGGIGGQQSRMAAKPSCKSEMP